MKFRIIFFLIFLTAIATYAAAQGVDVDPLKAKRYLIGPGDEITVKVLNEPQFDFVAVVGEDGRLEVPVVDQPIAAKCRTEPQLRADIGKALGKYLKEPQLNMRLQSRSRPPAIVYGEVRTAKEITLLRKATLVEMLAATGGITEDAGGMVQVFRTQAPMCDSSDEDIWKSDGIDGAGVPYRFFSLSSIKQGLKEANPTIYPGDVILVQKASPVYVTGEVVQPQGIYLKESGLTLTESIVKSSIELACGSSHSCGNARGSRDSWTCACSRWLR